MGPGRGPVDRGFGDQGLGIGDSPGIRPWQSTIIPLNQIQLKSPKVIKSFQKFRVRYPEKVGLSLNYALNVTGAMKLLVRMTSEIKTNMVSPKKHFSNV